MATPSQRLPPPTGSTSPTRGNWGRNGEPGAAFRGLGRGRAAAGGGPIRRGRGARGGDGAPRGTNLKGPGSGDNSIPPAKLDNPTPTKPILPTPSAEKPSVPITATPTKSKNTSRRASRSIPALIVNPASSNPEVSSTVPTTPSNRRRRPQHHKPVSVADKLAPPVEQNLLRPLRSHSGPSSPVALSKDIPPHFSASAGPEITSFDMRTNIDALVERVRAVAMAENRPTTPGSHIDWAGDDDDSLPDLNDWGVTTSLGQRDEKMSPILVDGLKTLPDAAVKPTPFSSGMEDTAGPSSVMNDGTTNDGAITPSVESVSRSERASREEKEHPKRAGRTPRALQLNSADEPKSAVCSAPFDRGLSPARTPPNVVVEAQRTPLHPSLPPKPVAAVESLSKPRIDVTPVQAAESLTLPASVETPMLKSAPASVADTLDHLKVQAQDAAVTRAVEQGVAQAPPPALCPPKFKDVNAVNGLTASIHAPKRLVESSSAPSDIASYGTSSTGFNPTHNRASTVGRLPVPQPVNSLPGSGSSTPRRHFGSPEGYHSRTHSTPPSGHRMSHTRPVITGDAISRLARTLLPGRTDVSTSKE